MARLVRLMPIGIKFSPDGRRLLAWRSEDAVQVFDAETGNRLGVYRTSFDNGTPSAEFAKGIAEARKYHLLPLVWGVQPVPNSRRFVVTTGGAPSKRK